MSTELRSLTTPQLPAARAPLVKGGTWRVRLRRGLLQLPLIRPFRERWQLLIGAPVYFESLRTACRLNLFRTLNQRPGLTLPEIAAALKIQEYPARVLLLTCTALQLLRKRGERYYCRWLAGQVFDPDSPRSIVPLVEWVHHIAYLSMFHYTEAIRKSRAAGLEVFEGNEDNLYGRLARNPQLEECFHKAMALRSRQSNRQLVRRVQFFAWPRVLDVGGGNGENLLTVAQYHPEISGTLLDFPTVAERAQQRFADEALSDRLEAVGANFLEEEFPGGYSCVLMAHLTPIFSETTNRDLFRKAYQALVPGGMLCLCLPLMDDDERGPLDSALLSPYFLCTVNGQGRHYSRREVLRWLNDTGFVRMDSCPLTINDHLIVGFKPAS